MNVRHRVAAIAAAAILPLSLVGAADAAPPSVDRRPPDAISWDTTLDVQVVSQRPDGSPSYGEQSSISADGRYVAFLGTADQIAAGAPSDPESDRQVLVRDVVSGRTAGASVSARGDWANSGASTIHPHISADGRYVVFVSGADNLVPPGVPHGSVYRKDMRTGRIAVVDLGMGGTAPDGSSFAPAISATGRFVTYESYAGNLVRDDTNGVQDVYLTDMLLRKTTRLSVTRDGRQSAQPSLAPSISHDGRRVALTTDAPLNPRDRDGTPDIYVVDTRSRAAVEVGPFELAELSPDGRWISFTTAAPLVPEDTNGVSDIYVQDLVRGVRTRVSVSSEGAQADLPSLHSAVSRDGRYVAFDSAASTLVPGDTNRAWDVFVRDVRIGVTTRVDLTPAGGQADDFTYQIAPAISAPGDAVTFDANAANVVDAPTVSTVVVVRPATP